MSQAIRNAAQALLPCPFCGHSKNIAMANTHHDHSGGYYIGCPECGASTELVFALMDDPRQILVEKWNRRVALSTPQPTADERVAEHMRLVAAAMRYSGAADDFSTEDTYAAVEQSARALLSASQEDAEMLDWLAANVTEAPIDQKSFEHMEFPDTRLRWVLPIMPSWAEYCGQISFKEAVKIAMKETK